MWQIKPPSPMFCKPVEAQRRLGVVGCNTKHVAFVPQTPYMPIGTLREAVLYPNGEDSDEWSFVGQNVTSCTGTCVSASSRRAGRWS